MKKILIVGCGIAGFHAACLAIADGRYHVMVTDISFDDDKKKKKEILIAEAFKRNVPINVELGKHTIDLVDSADLIVVSPGIKDSNPVVKRAIELGKEVIDETEFAFRYIKKEYNKIFAITGTNGKTTTTSLLAHILEYGGFSVYKGGNIGAPLSRYVLEGTEKDWIVLELSSFQLYRTRLLKCGFNTLLNIEPDHFDWHESFTDYVDAKFKLLSNVDVTCSVLANMDDAVIKREIFARKIEEKTKVFWFSVEDSLQEGVYLDNGWVVVKTPAGIRKILCIDSLSDTARFNLTNIMVASFWALKAGMESSDIRQAVKTFEFLPHRMEYIGTVWGRKIYNDSKATNPSAVKKALNFVDPPVVLIMGGQDKGLSFSELVSLVSGKVKAVVAYGEAACRINSELGNVVRVFECNKFEDAVLKAWECSEEGDTILLSCGCSSFDQFKSYAERGNVFKDIIRKISVF